MEDPIEFTIVMIKRELMRDIRLVGRMRDLENKYNRYEKYMKSMYTHEDDWEIFDDTYDYF